MTVRNVAFREDGNVVHFPQPVHPAQPEIKPVSKIDLLFPSRKLANLPSEKPFPDFVIDGLPIGDVGLVVATSGVGKTFALIDIAASIGSGRAMIGGAFKSQKVGKVGALFMEENTDILDMRLWEFRKQNQHLAGLIDKNVEFKALAGCTDLLMDEKGNPGPFFDMLMDFTQGMRLLILDPAVMLHAADENDNGKMTRFMRLLQAISVKNRHATICAHHTPKLGGGKEDGEQELARGAGAFTASARWQTNITGMSKAEAEKSGITDDLRRHWLRLAVVKANHIPPQQDVWLKRQDGGLLLKETKPCKKPGGQKPGGHAEVVEVFEDKLSTKASSEGGSGDGKDW